MATRTIFKTEQARQTYIPFGILVCLLGNRPALFLLVKAFNPGIPMA